MFFFLLSDYDNRSNIVICISTAKMDFKFALRHAAVTFGKL